MPYASREERLAYLRDYRAKNPDLRERTQYQRARRNIGREFLRALKDVPCMDCGGKFHHAAMDFDHRPDETKTWDLNRLIARNASVGRLKEEADKCDVVCANCHRVRTWERAQADENHGSNVVATELQRAARARRRRTKDDRGIAAREKEMKDK